MRVFTPKPLFIILIILMCISLSGCSKDDITIALNQENYNNQSASSGDNQSLDSGELQQNNENSGDTKHTVDTKNTADILNSEDDENNTNAKNKEDAENITDTEDEADINFVTVSETVFATANVNIRSGPTTDSNNILTLLKKGESIKRIGTERIWSKVSYHDDTYYIVSEYLTTQPPSTPTPTPTPKATPAPEVAKDSDKSSIVEPTPASEAADGEEAEADMESYSFVNRLSIGGEFSELVCIVGTGGSDCIVSFHKKDDNDTWVQLFQVDGDCGAQGITYQKREGDSKTPAGLYSFTLAFGLKSDPGTSLKYRKITKDDYWIDDYNSPYYNTWVNSKSTPGDYTSEHLIDHDPSYNYALNIDYNSDCVPGLGSAVFLHCYNGTGFTTGCIAISEKYMKTLVKEADASTQILIVPEEADLSNY
ncbi:MAG: S-layer protein [Firmicutes bacterium]|nr:S-layer protein [Bacillota bacterium]